MSKQRHLPDTERAGTVRSTERPVVSDVDGSILDQLALGNAALQHRMGAGEVAALGPAEALVPDLATPLVFRAMLALQLDSADPERLDRLVHFLQQSNLPDRQALVERLVAAETTRAMVDASLDHAFGAHDGATRDRADGTLAAVLESLASGTLDGSTWRDRTGEVDIGVDDTQGSGTDRAMAWIERLAEHREPGSGAAARDFCRSIATSLLLDEDEDDMDAAWAGPEEGG